MSVEGEDVSASDIELLEDAGPIEDAIKDYNSNTNDAKVDFTEKLKNIKNNDGYDKTRYENIKENNKKEYEEAYNEAYNNIKQLTTIGQLFSLYNIDRNESILQVSIALSLNLLSIASAIYIETQPYYVFCFKIKDEPKKQPFAMQYFIKEDYENDFFAHFPDEKAKFKTIKYNHYRIRKIADLIKVTPKTNTNTKEQDEGLQYMTKTTLEALDLFENEDLEVKEGQDVYCYYMICVDDYIGILGKDKKTSILGTNNNIMFRTMSRKVELAEIASIYTKYLE